MFRSLHAFLVMGSIFSYFAYILELEHHAYTDLTINCIFLSAVSTTKCISAEDACMFYVPDGVRDFFLLICLH